ncbi:hypothetical protein SAMN04488056_102391 [Cohaesibacter marisflavi]|uniref:Uncharacterized protein n=1 Tax=Cohaesibacter marisflavi TaxID=655353 RepID=A0A1I5CYC1_9HYPH|nr:hypothetical protein SAMN04488056_102391 [Cohaesibacter marisflavi]
MSLLASRLRGQLHVQPSARTLQCAKKPGPSHREEIKPRPDDPVKNSLLNLAKISGEAGAIIRRTMEAGLLGAGNLIGTGNGNIMTILQKNCFNHRTATAAFGLTAAPLIDLVGMDRGVRILFGKPVRYLENLMIGNFVTVANEHQRPVYCWRIACACRVQCHIGSMVAIGK